MNGEQLKGLGELVSAAAAVLWGVAALWLIALLGPRLRTILQREAEVHIEVLGMKLRAGTKVNRTVLDPVFAEVGLVVKELSGDRRTRFVEIVQTLKATGSYQLPDSFVRHSENHKQLGTLRRLSLIRPREGGSWRAGKHVEITNFARLAMALAGPDLSLEPRMIRLVNENT